MEVYGPPLPPDFPNHSGLPLLSHEDSRVVIPPTLNSSPDTCLHWRDGVTVERYGPPLPPDVQNHSGLPLPSQEDSRVVIPLIPYKCGNTQKSWSARPPQAVSFFTDGRLGVKLPAAFNGDFKGIDDRDDFPLSENKSGITIRINVGS